MAKEKSANPVLVEQRKRKEKEKLKNQQNRQQAKLLNKLKSDETAKDELQRRIDTLNKASKKSRHAKRKANELQSIQNISKLSQTPTAATSSNRVFDIIDRIERGEDIPEDLEDPNAPDLEDDGSLAAKYLTGQLDVGALKSERTAFAEKRSWIAHTIRERNDSENFLLSKQQKRITTSFPEVGSDDEEDSSSEEDEMKRDITTIITPSIGATGMDKVLRKDAQENNVLSEESEDNSDEEVDIEDLPPPPSLPVAPLRVVQLSTESGSNDDRPSNNVAETSQKLAAVAELRRNTASVNAVPAVHSTPAVIHADPVVKPSHVQATRPIRALVPTTVKIKSGVKGDQVVLDSSAVTFTSTADKPEQSNGDQTTVEFLKFLQSIPERTTESTTH